MIVTAKTNTLESVMLRKAGLKSVKSNRKTTSAKRRPKKAARTPPHKAATATRGASPTPSAPLISRDVVEEILVHSAKSAEGDKLSDKALMQIAGAAALNSAKILYVHERLCEAADAEAMTVFQVVELWGSNDE